jgi:hypothetical protein
MEAEGTPSSSAPLEVQGSPVADAPFRNVNKTQSSEQDLEDDINTVVRFFAEGNDRDKSEDETLVWQRLETKVGSFWLCVAWVFVDPCSFRLHARLRAVGKHSM